MALTIGSTASGGVYCRELDLSRHRRIPFPSTRTANPSLARTSPHGLIVTSAKKLSSRPGRFDSKNKRSTTTTNEEEGAEEEIISTGNGSVDSAGNIDDGYFLPELPGDKPDFWEGSQWDALGFFVQYLWAFGIVFALIACGIAVATYNEGATDFKETPAYKESVQSRDLLEEPDASDSDVFESNPTEQAPSLE